MYPIKLTYFMHFCFQNSNCDHWFKFVLLRRLSSLSRYVDQINTCRSGSRPVLQLTANEYKFIHRMRWNQTTFSSVAWSHSGTASQYAWLCNDLIQKNKLAFSHLRLGSPQLQQIVLESEINNLKSRINDLPTSPPIPQVGFYYLTFSEHLKIQFVL